MFLKISTPYSRPLWDLGHSNMLLLTFHFPRWTKFGLGVVSVFCLFACFGRFGEESQWKLYRERDMKLEVSTSLPPSFPPLRKLTRPGCFPRAHVTSLTREDKLWADFWKCLWKLIPRQHAKKKICMVRNWHNFLTPQPAYFCSSSQYRLPRPILI